jgi:hypothetical protein
MCAGDKEMVQKLIIVLTVIAVIVLYQGMRHELAAPKVDLRRPVDVNLILGAIQAKGLPCDIVDSFTLLGTNDDGWDSYLARCHDGGRYVFFKHTAKSKVGVKSCAEEAALGYRCPR